MTLEQLVTDLATSQQLKATGFPQDTAMVWVEFEKDWAYQLMTQEDAKAVVHVDEIGAPTAGELEEWLMAKGYKFRCAKNLFGAYAIVASRLDEDEDDKEHHPYDGYNEKHVAALAQLCLEVAG